MQNALTGRFQEYVDSFDSTNNQGTEIDTTAIGTVPITAFIANYDSVCQPRFAESHLDGMATDVKKHYFATGHDYFAYMNSYDYFDLIECEL